ncbi:phage/plasmid primase, P4 family, C-terminal domain [Opitutaceae bacterium TAV1]|nr:phage/plasmid primase, P4 family, C-terminal domain [Opitutaceae bacterium TAV1]
MPEKNPSEPSEKTGKQAGKDAVAAIYTALGGRPVLLRIPRGRKGPIDKGWSSITWEDTQDEAYQESLCEGGNIGVSLGWRSAAVFAGETFHLCSIDIDDSASLDPFLEANERLRGTLITSGHRGANLWLWVRKDSYPMFAGLKWADGADGADGKGKWGEWRADGTKADGTPAAYQTVIWGVHPEGMRYRRISDAQHPLRIDFDEIVWPEGLHLPWKKSDWEEMIIAHGEPWHVSKKGNVTLNPPFFVSLYSLHHKVLFEPEEERFYDYCEARGLWVVDSEDAIRWKFSVDFKRLADQAEERAEIAASQIETKRTNAMLQGLVSLLRGAVERRDVFKHDAGIVHLQNGMLDLRRQPPDLSNFAASYYSRNQIPVAMDEKAKCPRFLGELLGGGISNGNDIAMIQRWAGQLLLGHNLTQKIMILTGTAGGGKTTLLNMLATVVGRANVAGVRTAHLHKRFELWNYVGKTFLIGADVPGNFLMTEGAHVLKALVGRDVLTAEKKNGDSITIEGDFNVGLTSNSRLQVRLDGDTDAWRRRLLIVNYERPRPAHPNPRFVEELLASEASGILNWMIEGAMKLMAEIRESGTIAMTEEQRARVDSLLAESDSIREFVRKGIAPCIDFDVTTHEIVEAYIAFCEVRGWTPLPSRKVEATAPDVILEVHRVAKRNDILRGDKNQRGYRGIRILPIAGADREDPQGKEADDGAPFG